MLFATLNLEELPPKVFHIRMQSDGEGLHVSVWVFFLFVCFVLFFKYSMSRLPYFTFFFFFPQTYFMLNNICKGCLETELICIEQI